MSKTKQWMMENFDERDMDKLRALEIESQMEKFRWDDFCELIHRNRVGTWALVLYRTPDHTENYVIEQTSLKCWTYPTTIIIGTSDKKEDLEMYCKYKSINLI